MKIRKILVMALTLTVVSGVADPFAAEMPYHSFAAKMQGFTRQLYCNRKLLNYGKLLGHFI